MRLMLGDGGGALGAFMAGAIDHLAQTGKVDPRAFDVYGGTSVSSCIFSYTVTNQIKEGVEIFSSHLPQGFFRKKWRLPYNDIGYLEYVFRNSPEALDVVTLKKRQKVHMPLADPLTLGTKMVCLNEQDDPIAWLLKGVFMPGLSAPRTLPGQTLYDGGLTCQPPLVIEKMTQATEVWFLSPYVPGYRLNSWIFRLASLVLGARDLNIRKLVAGCPELENSVRKELESRTDIHVICPNEPLPIGWHCIDPQAMKLVLQLGRDAAKRFLLSYRQR